MSFLDFRDMASDRRRWQPITRGQAIICCRNRPVIVIDKQYGYGMASWFTPASRYFHSHGAYNYQGIRYFLFVANETPKAYPTSAAQGPLKTPDWVPISELEPLITEEPPPKKLYPISFELKTAGGKPLPPTPYRVIMPNGEIKTGISGADGKISFPDNPYPGQAKLELLPQGLPAGKKPEDTAKPIAKTPEPISPIAEPQKKPGPEIEASTVLESETEAAVEILDPGFRPGYAGTEDKASAPGILDFKKTDALIRDLDEAQFRQAFVDAAMVMHDLGLNRTQGEPRAQAYLDMVTWDAAYRSSWKNDHSVNSSSCGMFVRNIWWLCGARGTPLFDGPYKGGVLTDLIGFDSQASRKWGEFNAKTFFPKIGDTLYLYDNKTNGQHIFIICGIDKKIVEENGQTTVYNADGSPAKEITFTSVDGGQADGFGPDGNGKNRTWGCQGIRKCQRRMKLDNGHFMNIGVSWPFPDKAAGRPINTWISIWDARNKFTAPRIKPSRHGASAGSQATDEDTSLYYLRIKMDVAEARKLQEKFVLASTDGTFEQIKTVNDDLIPGDDCVDLEFTGVPKSLSYSMKILSGDGKPYFLFENVPFAKLDGYMP